MVKLWTLLTFVCLASAQNDNVDGSGEGPTAVFQNNQGIIVSETVVEGSGEAPVALFQNSQGSSIVSESAVEGSGDDVQVIQAGPKDVQPQDADVVKEVEEAGNIALVPAEPTKTEEKVETLVDTPLVVDEAEIKLEEPAKTEIKAETIGEEAPKEEAPKAETKIQIPLIVEEVVKSINNEEANKCSLKTEKVPEKAFMLPDSVMHNIVLASPMGNAKYSADTTFVVQLRHCFPLAITGEDGSCVEFKHGGLHLFRCLAGSFRHAFYKESLIKEIACGGCPSAVPPSTEFGF